MNNLTPQNIKDKIHTIRNAQVMLDKDLAELYGVKPIRIREQVKRNKERFPDDFMFVLSQSEVDLMVSQFAIPSKQHLGGALPMVFTEQGVSMLANVLKSKQAINTSIQIIRAFVAMRQFIAQNVGVFQRLENVEQKLLSHDKKFSQVFKALQSEPPKQGIFYDGQIYESYAFVSNLIKKAKKRIWLIDNYIDETTLTLLIKNPNAKITLFAKNIAKSLRLDADKFNAQFSQRLTLKEFALCHDRFLIIDDEIYHFGASLKDLGKKWFAFSKMNDESLQILKRLEKESR